MNLFAQFIAQGTIVRRKQLTCILLPTLASPLYNIAVCGVLHSLLLANENRLRTRR